MGDLEVLENHLGNTEETFLKHTKQRLLHAATLSTLTLFGPVGHWILVSAARIYTCGLTNVLLY